MDRGRGRPRWIQDSYRSGARTITPDVARSYIEHLTDADDEDDYRNAYVRVAALAMLPQTRAKLDEEADAISKEWLDEHRVAIKSLPESRQSLYAEITKQEHRSAVDLDGSAEEPAGRDETSVVSGMEQLP